MIHVFIDAPPQKPRGNRYEGSLSPRSIVLSILDLGTPFWFKEKENHQTKVSPIRNSEYIYRRRKFKTLFGSAGWLREIQNGLHLPRGIETTFAVKFMDLL